MKKLVSKIKNFGFLKVVLIIVVVIAVCNVCYRKYEENILRSEINKIVELDFTTGNFNRPTKTIANYQRVEKAIKFYLTDYSNQTKEILSVINNEKLRSVLSASNYTQDGPNFSNTMAYLTSSKERINQEVEKLSHLSEKRTISSYISSYHFNRYYQNVYHEYMISGIFSDVFEDNMESVKKSSKAIIHLIDQEIKVLQFLSGNHDWIVKDEQIIFSKQEDLDLYNSLISEIV